MFARPPSFRKICCYFNLNHSRNLLLLLATDWRNLQLFLCFREKKIQCSTYRQISYFPRPIGESWFFLVSDRLIFRHIFSCQIDKFRSFSSWSLAIAWWIPRFYPVTGLRISRFYSATNRWISQYSSLDWTSKFTIFFLRPIDIFFTVTEKEKIQKNA